MGALVSLPLTATLAVPFLSSYTTSLNLLFFTLNWYILLLTNPPLLVEVYGLAIMRLLFFLLPALAFLAFDTGIPSLAQQIKAQGALGLPSRAGRKKTARIVAWALFNTILGVVLQAGLELVFTKGLRMRSLLSLSKQLPMPWTAVQSVALGLALRGVRTCSPSPMEEEASQTDLIRPCNISRIDSFSTTPPQASSRSSILHGNIASPPLIP
jgi:hypothetical protein